MQSRRELEEAVTGWLMRTKHKGRDSKYQALVRSSVQMGGIGCDGRIMMEVEETAEERLASVADEDLRRIWEETENAQLSANESDVYPCRVTMIEDIKIDLIEEIARMVCSEAEDIGKAREMKRKANPGKRGEDKQGIAMAAAQDVFSRRHMPETPQVPGGDNMTSDASDAGPFDTEGIAEDVLAALDALDVEELWDRSGSSRYGYTEPVEEAEEMVEDELQPFVDEILERHVQGRADEEKAYCMGVILGLYRFAEESKSEFKDWAADGPLESATMLLKEWQKRTRDDVRAHQAMGDFIRERCPQWAKHLAR